jgi:4-hydroxybenzoate polyprenyltransferase
VDLDGTIIRSDTLIEALWIFVRRKPWSLWKLFIWLWQGRSRFKASLFAEVQLNPQWLPYHQEVLNFLKQEKNQGRRLILVTAAPLEIAKNVAAHLTLFDEVMASTDTQNLKGDVKARALAEKFGDQGFDYMANSSVDMAVWEKANQSLVVSDSDRLVAKVRSKTKLQQAFRISRSSQWRLVFKQIRVHQWVKNALIFLPMILSHQYDSLSVWLQSLLAFGAFSLTSSAVYVLNDLFDLESDRQHPQNRARPFASGELSLFWAFVLLPVLLLGAALLTWTQPLPFIISLASYLALTSLYSFRLKEIVLADILVLASLYSWRVFAGSMATGIDLSEWFLTFAIFFFFSLALLKRSAELISFEKSATAVNPRRGYRVTDLPLLVCFGVGSGYLSVLVLALYLNDPNVLAKKEMPVVLWLICPFLLYWVSRMWLKAYRGEMPTDPIIFAIKDNVSYGLLLTIAGLWLLSRGGWLF